MADADGKDAPEAPPPPSEEEGRAGGPDPPAAAVVADEDDEEEEGEGGKEAPQMLLGFAEEVEEGEQGMLLRHRFPSKIGGDPAWLDPVDLPRGGAGACGICSRPLEFLLQVYCPLEMEDREDLFHRTVFVFTCRNGKCLEQGGGVRAFRGQLPRKNQLYGFEPAAETDDAPPEPPGGQPPLCGWCGVWRADKRCGQCKGPMYCSREHQTEHWKGGHKAECKEGAPTGGKSLKKHPELNLVVEPEPEEGEGEGESKEERLIREMVERQAVEGEATDEEMSDVTNLDHITAEKKQWAAFQTRVALAPEQVLRYQRGEGCHPLWPSLRGQAKQGDVPPCGRCGGPRDFEFQVMPQLLSYMDVDSEDPSSLDWSTIAVYTCRASCRAPEVDVKEAAVKGESTAYVEEFSWVQPASLEE